MQFLLHTLKTLIKPSQEFPLLTQSLLKIKQHQPQVTGCSVCV